MSEHIFESEIEIRSSFHLRNKILTLTSDISGIIQKLFYFPSDLWDNIYKYKNQNPDKNNIECRNNDICCGILSCDQMGTIFLPMKSPCVYFLSEILPEFEKNIGKKKGNKKEHEKIREAISDEKKEGICDELSPKEWSKNDGECCFDGNHIEKCDTNAKSKCILMKTIENAKMDFPRVF